MTAAARPYAEALYAAAAAQGAVEETLTALEAVGEALRASPEAALLLRHPEVGPAAAAKMVVAVAGQCPALVGRFLRLLFARRRMGMLDAVITALHERVDAEAGVLRGRLESVHGVSGELAGRVTAALDRRTGKHVVLTAADRPELIGGLRVVMGDRILDVTVAGRLEALRRQLLASGADGLGATR